jgi:3-oxoadipate enol-lactonase
MGYHSRMTEQVFEVRGVSLRVVTDGDRSRPALALVNGAFSNLEVWTPALEQLASRFFVVRHDWRGTGLSSGGPRAQYTFPDYADDLAGILDALAIPRAIVWGMAYGARTAARFALRHAARTALLALYDVSLAPPVDQALQRAGNAEAKHLRELAGLPSVEADPRWYEHADRREALRSLTAHERVPDPTEELRAVQIPTLVACGRQDVNLAEAQRIAALMPDAELHVMEMTGHGSVLSRPELCVQLLCDFVARRLPA